MNSYELLQQLEEAKEKFYIIKTPHPQDFSSLFLQCLCKVRDRIKNK